MFLESLALANAISAPSFHSKAPPTYGYYADDIVMGMRFMMNGHYVSYDTWNDNQGRCKEVIVLVRHIAHTDGGMMVTLTCTTKSPVLELYP